jgi:hypothetical protein
MHELNNGAINRDPDYRARPEDIVYRDAVGNSTAMDSIKNIDPSLWTTGIIADATGRYPSEISYNEMVFELITNPGGWPDCWLAVLHDYFEKKASDNQRLAGKGKPTEQLEFREEAGPQTQTQ